MEPKRPSQTPIEAPQRNNKALQVVLVCVLLVIAILATYLLQQQRIDDLQRQLNDHSHDQYQEESHSEAPGDKTTTVATEDSQVKVIVPETWVANRQTQIESQGCLATVAQEVRGNCLLHVSLAPHDFASESAWSLSVFQTQTTAADFATAALGQPTAEFQTNQEKINDYDTYYARVTAQSYTDIYYIISHHGHLAYFQAREVSRHFTPEGTVNQVVDNSAYTPDFVQIVRSISFQE